MPFRTYAHLRSPSAEKSTRADDLVQETLLRAMANISSFQPGTNMSAWLTTILRNVFVSEYRKRRYEVQDTDGLHFDSLIAPPEQHSRLEFDEFRGALDRLVGLRLRDIGVRRERVYRLCPVGGFGPGLSERLVPMHLSTMGP